MYTVDRKVYNLILNLYTSVYWFGRKKGKIVYILLYTFIFFIFHSGHPTSASPPPLLHPLPLLHPHPLFHPISSFTFTLTSNSPLHLNQLSYRLSKNKKYLVLYRMFNWTMLRNKPLRFTTATDGLLIFFFGHNPIFFWSPIQVLSANVNA